MPQLTLNDFADGNAHLNKITCSGGKCRSGPAVHLQKTAVESHDSILHGLNRRVGKLFFGVEPFEPTIDAWNGIPQVFAKSHPEPRLFSKDPMAELDRINGAIVGESSDPRIEMVGHPTLWVKKNYTEKTAIRMFEAGMISEDQLNRSKAAVPIALKLYEESKLSHSSGFICPDDGDKLTGIVIPNHILDFEETVLDQPLDRMSVILNKEENEESKEVDNVTEPKAQLNEGKVMSKKNQTRLKDILDGILSFFNDTVGTADEVVNAEVAPPKTTGKTNMEVIPGSPPASSFEGRIEIVRNALSENIGLKWQDGTPKNVWTVMTLPDKVIWQNPDTSQYFTSSYMVDGDTVTFGTPAEVEQAYVVKEANNVFVNMTAQDIEQITRRNKMDTTEKTAMDATLKEKEDLLAAKDAELSKLQKERDDLLASQEQDKKNKEEAAWTELKKTVISPGLVKEPADEAALRKLCKEDPVAFNVKVLTARTDPKFKEEGTEHVSGPDAAAQEQKEINEVLERSRGRNTPGQLH